MNTCSYYTSTPNPNTTTTSLDGSLPANMYLFLYNNERIINLDGSFYTEDLSIEIPYDNFISWTSGVVVNDELFIFTDHYEIYQIIDCKYEKTNIENPLGNTEYMAVLSLENGGKALMCFKNNNNGFNHQDCWIFDGNKITNTTYTNYAHTDGALAFYEGQPTAFGCRWTTENSGARKVETLNDSNSWIELADHQYDMAYVTLVGLENGALLSLGGKFNTNDDYPWLTQTTNDIWMLKKNKWSLIGQLKNRLTDPSLSLVIGSVFYVFASDLLRFEFDDDQITSQESVGNSWGPSAYVQTTKDFCFDINSNYFY